MGLRAGKQANHKAPSMLLLSLFSVWFRFFCLVGFCFLFFFFVGVVVVVVVLAMLSMLENKCLSPQKR